MTSTEYRDIVVSLVPDARCIKMRRDYSIVKGTVNGVRDMHIGKGRTTTDAWKSARETLEKELQDA